ncbi:MAG: lamin tail domain-containing protein [Phycisphaerae bacterium]|nr:lamin tail domain-containing protein [Phycisphaerae bacterium]
MNSNMCQILLCVILAALPAIGTLYAACPAGDLNGDCVIDIDDLLVIAEYWLTGECSIPTCGDMNFDGQVDMSDLAVVADEWRRAASPLVINEFMASNSTTLADEDGDFSDWIEIRNISNHSVNMQGWFLTDSAGNPAKWAFPDMQLDSGGYLVVFASGKDRSDPAGRLHTNFSLDRVGEYLALTNPDRGMAHAYPDPFPPQLPEISYGLIANAITARLIKEGDPIKHRVPADDLLSNAWHFAAFDDSSWSAGFTPAGYEQGGKQRQAANLIACWTFDDDLLDHSGNGNHATPKGTTYSSDIPPTIMSGKSLAFNGLSDYLQVADSPALNLATGAGQAFTVAFWFKTTETQAKVVMEKGSRKHFVTRMEAFADAGKISFRMQEGVQNQVISREPVNDGQWHHFLASFDGDTLRLYIDGVLNAQAQETGHPDNNDPLVIGSRFGAAPWKGTMDDLAIWDVALDEARIADLSDGSVRPLDVGAVVSAVDERLAGYWDFNGTVADVSCRGHNASNFGAVFSTDVPGAVARGMSLQFDGINDYVLIPDAPDLRIASRFTLSLWMKSNNINQVHKYLLSRHGGGYQQAVIFEYVDNHVEFFAPNAVGGDPRPGSQMPVPDSDWHHIAYTSDGSLWSGYVDGTRIFSVQREFALHTGEYPWYVGAANASAAFFDGWIDEVSIWTEALSENEVAALASGVSPHAVLGYEGLIRTDLEAAMYAKNASVYVRHAFEVEDPAQLEDLRLSIKYDDGFIAYLNGAEMARRNAPSPAPWNATATTSHPDEQAVVFEEIDVSPFRALLQAGTNILAVHGLNQAADDDDFLWSCELTAAQPWQSSQRYRYFSKPTPGAPNGESAQDIGPVIDQVAHTPTIPSAGDVIIVTASINESFFPLDTARVIYRVMYGPQISIPMRDDGTPPDQTAGDSIYTAAIPATACAPGEMVRWYVKAVDVRQNQSRWPLFNNPADSPEYLGTVVNDPSVTSSIPIFHWFVEPGAEQAARTRSGARCALFYDGCLYDNIFVRLRGATAAGLAKNPYKFEFNKGYDFIYSADAPPVDEFDLNTTYRDKAYIRPILGYELYRDAGVPCSNVLPVHIRRNNQFFSVAIFTEHPDKTFLKRNSLDPEGTTYKANLNGFTPGPQGGYLDMYAGFEKKTPKDNDNADIVAFVNGLAQTGSARTHFVFDNVDIPAVVNYMAASVLIQDADRLVTNFFAYRDPHGSGEWTMLPWDLDLSLGQAINSSDQMFAAHDYPNGPSHPFYGAQNSPDWRNPHLWNKMIDVFCNTPELRQMFLRRLRTLMDRFLMPSDTPREQLYFENRIDELYTLMAEDVLLDKAKWSSWGQSQTFRQALDRIENDYLAPRRTHLYVNHGADQIPSNPAAVGIPAAQIGRLAIDFGTIEYNPASGNQDEEYIELVNNNNTAVDISGWRITGGVEYTFKPGAVVPPACSLYVSPSVTAFRNRATGPSGGQGCFVQGSYKGHLSNWGELLHLVDGDAYSVASASYPADPTDQQNYLRITELMYHPAGGGDYNKEEYEYIELKNLGDAPLPLAGVKFTDGVTYAFADGPILPPNGFVVLAKNPDAFASRYTVPEGVDVLGPYEGNLSNSGENITLDDASNSTILDFSYSDKWYPSTDGGGFSLTFIDAHATSHRDWDRPSSWRPSTCPGGSPGRDDNADCP